MENPYTRAPLQVTLYDVSAGSPVRSYMLLGNVPRAVLEAARRGRPGKKSRAGSGKGRFDNFAPQHPAGRREAAPRFAAATQSSAWPIATWSKADEATLRRFYGSRWRWLLTPRVGVVAGTGYPSSTTSDFLEGREGGLGGIEGNEAGLGDIDALEDVYAPGGENILENTLGGGAGEDVLGVAGEGFGNLDDFDRDDIEAATEADTGAAPAGVGAPSPSASPEADWDPRTVYLGQETYHEDTFTDVKAKVYAATGVPPYRQHLFYSDGDSSTPRT